MNSFSETEFFMKYREIHLMKCITIQMGSINSIYNIEYIPILPFTNNF